MNARLSRSLSAVFLKFPVKHFAAAVRDMCCNVTIDEKSTTAAADIAQKLCHVSLSMCILSRQWWDFHWSLQAGAYLSPIIFPLINFFVNSRRLVIIVGGDDEVCARQWESLWYEKRKWNKIIIICCFPAKLFFLSRVLLRRANIVQ